MNILRWRAGLNSLRAMIILIPLLYRPFAYAEPTAKSTALIQIGVEVVEVDEMKTKNLGIEWINSLLITEADVPSVLKLGELTRSKFGVLLHALEQNGAADLLANPKLVTRDGTTASFHAGGELPYATKAGSGDTVTVDFKPYGVNLNINPHLEADNRITISVKAAVSGPDDQNTVILSGNVVPGIRSRDVASEVTMNQGSTLTLAGMIQNEKQWTATGVPGLMHVPVVGGLFRHKIQTNHRTSIVVFITPTVISADTEPLPRPAAFPDLSMPGEELGDSHG